MGSKAPLFLALLLFLAAAQARTDASQDNDVGMPYCSTHLFPSPSEWCGAFHVHLTTADSYLDVAYLDADLLNCVLPCYAYGHLVEYACCFSIIHT
jgi:hypothetical protein